jgi:hypothetical protein
MGFPEEFIACVKAMHCDVSTCFILDNLSREVPVRISVRQGDPLAMPLYLLNIEPLLVQIGLHITGAPVCGLSQKDEDYVDDVSCVSTNLQDMVVMNVLFLEFEGLSGTVLNRSQKSKIMGIGGWADRDIWPLTWLQTVPSVRIFGINFHPTVELTVKETWKGVASGLRKCLLSWKQRHLPTLSARAFVVQTYALSKLWYVAQVLPLPQATGRVVRAVVGQFLWKGRLERLPLDELYAPPKEGGLGLPCLEAKCDSLLITHMSRVLYSNSRSKGHLSYWMGISLRECLPQLVQGPNAEIMTSYFKNLCNVFKESDVDVNQLGKVKCSEVYASLTSTLPPPKIEYKIDRDWQLCWKRLAKPNISCEARDVMFAVLHDIYPTNYRLFRMNMHPTGLCNLCPNAIDTVVHKFTKCVQSSEVWNYCVAKVCDLYPVVDDLSLFYLDFPMNSNEVVILKLLSNTFLYLYTSFKVSDIVSVESCKGFLKSRGLNP